MAPPEASRHELDTPTKNRIIGRFLESGNAADAGRKENVNLRAAQRVVKRFKETNSTANKPRPGRPKVLNAYDHHQLVRNACKNRRLPLRELKYTIAADVSERTI